MALLKPFVKRNSGFLAGMPSSRVASTNSENMEMSGVRVRQGCLGVSHCGACGDWFDRSQSKAEAVVMCVKT